jgi:hypothetical protein
VIKSWRRAFFRRQYWPMVFVASCLPNELRNQALLESLTPPSRNTLLDAAMALVFGT